MAHLGEHHHFQGVLYGEAVGLQPAYMAEISSQHLNTGGGWG